MIEAVRSAMDVSMARDDDVVVFGEDVGYFGGVFRATQGCRRNTAGRAASTRRSANPASSAPHRMAAYGLKPCVEIQFRRLHVSRL